jgi:CubicO group peptidase (beta-lactamase class C family)
MRGHITIIYLFLITVQFESLAQNKKLDTFFNKKMEKANIAGMQVAFIKNGELSWVGSYGMRNDSTKEKVNDSTSFMIASCSKPVTALALMKLYDSNLLDLDDDINKYLPFKITNPNFPENVITIRMLLTHTSSFVDNNELLESLYTYKNGGDSPIKQEQFIRDYFLPIGNYYDSRKNFSVNEPGSQKAYCNAGYALAGYLIECVTHKPFKEYMYDDIFKPLKMYNSFWFLSDFKSDNISFPHIYVTNKTKNGQFNVLKNYGYPTVSDGQLRTNTTEYAQFIKLMLNEGKVGEIQFLKKKTISIFLSIQFPLVNKYQAIAWNYNEFDNWIYYLLMPRLPSHTGVDRGVATVTSFNPITKNGAIIFANTLTHNFKLVSLK